MPCASLLLPSLRFGLEHGGCGHSGCSVESVDDVASGAERTGRHVVVNNARCVFSGAGMSCTSLLLPSVRFGLWHGG